MSLVCIPRWNCTILPLAHDRTHANKPFPICAVLRDGRGGPGSLLYLPPLPITPLTEAAPLFPPGAQLLWKEE